MEVDAAGINARQVRITRGDLSACPQRKRTIDAERRREGRTEVSRGHSRHIDHAEGLNEKVRQTAMYFDGEGDAG